MMFNFSNFVLNLQVNVRIIHQNDNFYFKDHEDNFEERYRLKDIFRVVYFETMLNQKLIID
jgi:hypothetical protein